MSYIRLNVADGGFAMLHPSKVARMWGGDIVAWVVDSHPARTMAVCSQEVGDRGHIVHPGWNALSFGATLASLAYDESIPHACLRGLRLVRAVLASDEAVPVDCAAGVAYPKTLTLEPIFGCSLCFCLARSREGAFRPPWPWGHSFGLEHDPDCGVRLHPRVAHDRMQFATPPRDCLRASTPAGRPTGPPAADSLADLPAGPPADPPTDLLTDPPAGPPADPPAVPLAGPPADPPTDSLTDLLTGLLVGPPAGPPAGPPPGPPPGPRAKLSSDRRVTPVAVASEQRSARWRWTPMSLQDVRALWGSDLVAWVPRSFEMGPMGGQLGAPPAGSGYMVFPGWNALSFGREMIERGYDRGELLATLKLVRVRLEEGSLRVDTARSAALAANVSIAPIEECNLCYCEARARVVEGAYNLRHAADASCRAFAGGRRWWKWEPTSLLALFALWGDDFVSWVPLDFEAARLSAPSAGFGHLVFPGWNALSFGRELAEKGQPLAGRKLVRVRLAEGGLNVDRERSAVLVTEGVEVSPIGECSLCYCAARCRVEGAPYGLRHAADASCRAHRQG